MEIWVQTFISWILKPASSSRFLAEKQYGKKEFCAGTCQQHHDCCPILMPRSVGFVHPRQLILTYYQVYNSSLGQMSSWGLSPVPRGKKKKKILVSKLWGSFISSAGSKGPKSAHRGIINLFYLFFTCGLCVYPPSWIMQITWALNQETPLKILSTAQVRVCFVAQTLFVRAGCLFWKRWLDAEITGWNDMALVS